MNIDALENVLKRTKPALLYTIPSFQNPCGQSMSAERRQRLAELSREHDFVVAADEVYQMLWYRNPPPPALGTLADQGNILSLGSFSKILAPGLRLGWIQTSPPLMERLLDSGVINSGGSFNHFTSLVVREAHRPGPAGGVPGAAAGDLCPPRGGHGRSAAGAFWRPGAMAEALWRLLLLAGV